MVEFADVILTREQGHTDTQRKDGKHRSLDVLHCPSLSFDAGQSLPRPDRERAI